MASSHLPICISKLLVHFEFKVPINVVRRAKKNAKIGQKWLKNGQLMAIISHKWLIIWLKNDIFINLSWHGGCGPLLSLFEHLEVPFAHKSFITLPVLSE